MLVDVTRKMPDWSGKDSEITLRELVLILITPTPRLPMEGDGKLSERVKAQLFSAGCKIATQDKPDLTVEEISAIKERFNTHGSILARGRVHEMLDPPALTEVAASGS